MLKENSKVQVYLCNHQTFPEIGDEVKTRSSGVIFKVKKQNGRLGIDFNTSRSPYTCGGEIFTPFETFASNVVFADVETGKQYHYSNITGSLEKVMIEFHGLVNNEEHFITKTLPQLKRLASRYCNNSYNPVDEMRVTVHNINKCENTAIFYLHRLNAVCPNNTIKRGAWK